MFLKISEQQVGLPPHVALLKVLPFQLFVLVSRCHLFVNEH